MLLKFIAAGVLAVASFSAYAGDQTIDVIADGRTYTFSAVVGDGILSGGHDLITLGNLGAGKYNIGLTVSGQNLKFSQELSNLNGVRGKVFDYDNDNTLQFFGVTFSGVGPFVLDLAGKADLNAGYAGTYTVSAVPEPATYGMLLGGLGLLGFMARRRSVAKAV